MKKVLPLFLVLALVLSMSSCSKRLADPPTPEPTEIPTTEPTPEPTPPPTVLGQTEDRGQDYIDRFVFLGDSTTYGLAFYDVLPHTQVWTPASGTLTLNNWAVETVEYYNGMGEAQSLSIEDATARRQPEYLIITLGLNGIRYFNCSNYKGNRGTCTSTHYIRVDFLEQVVLGEIRRLTKFASKYETLFAQAVMGCSRQNAETEREAMKKEVYALQARDRELDVLFEKLYEDNVAGKITDERFARMSKKYEEEQKELTEKIKSLKTEIDKTGSQAVTADMFISTVRKYTRAKKLTPRMLNELIQYIEVHQAEKVDGVWEQKLTIHYNCVGVIDIPAELSLPYPEVSVNTRKGVTVCYAPNAFVAKEAGA